MLSCVFDFNCRYLTLIAGIFGEVVFISDSGRHGIIMSSLDTSDTTTIALPFQNVTTPYGIAFNPLDNRIYWTDSTRGVVARSSIGGKDQEVVHSPVFRPRGIALDLVGGNMYWISNGGRSIEVSKLNGSYWKVLVSNLYDDATDITLDTTRGYSTLLLTYYTICQIVFFNNA